MIDFQLKHRLMKRNILLALLTLSLVISCAPPDHSHDGTYKGFMSTWVIDGNDLTIYMMNVRVTGGTIRFEGNTAYVGSGNVQQLYRIMYDKDSTKMFVLGDREPDFMTAMKQVE